MGTAPARTLALRLQMVEPMPTFVDVAVDRIMLRDWMECQARWIPGGLTFMRQWSAMLRAVPPPDQVESHPFTVWLRIWRPYILGGDLALGWWLHLCEVGHG